MSKLLISVVIAEKTDPHDVNPVEHTYTGCSEVAIKDGDVFIFGEDGIILATWARGSWKYVERIK